MGGGGSRGGEREGGSRGDGEGGGNGGDEAGAASRGENDEGGRGGEQQDDAVGKVVDQVSTMGAGVEGGILGQGGGGGVQLEAGIRSRAGPLAIGVDPDAGVASSMVSEFRGRASEGGRAGRKGRGGEGGGWEGGEEPRASQGRCPGGSRRGGGARPETAGTISRSPSSEKTGIMVVARVGMPVATSWEIMERQGSARGLMRSWSRLK